MKTELFTFTKAGLKAVEAPREPYFFQEAFIPEALKIVPASTQYTGTDGEGREQADRVKLQQTLKPSLHLSLCASPEFPLISEGRKVPIFLAMTKKSIIF